MVPPRFDSTGGRSYTWSVRQEILAAFVDAVRQVFRDTDIAIDSVDAGDAVGADAQVIASVGLTGDLKGIFMLRTDMDGAARHSQGDDRRDPARTSPTIT